MSGAPLQGTTNAMIGKKLTLTALGLGAAAVVVACGSMGDNSAFGTSGSGNKSDAEGGADGLGGGTSGMGPALNTDQSVSGIIAIHASRNLPAFRLCFPNNMHVLPLPDDKLMPNANVVGVDIGAAVHIGTLADTGSGTTGSVGLDGGAYDAGSTAPADGGDASAPKDAGGTAVDAGPPSSDVVYVIEEKLARQFYPQGTDAQAWPDCGPLRDVLVANGYEGHGFYTVHSANALGAGVLGTDKFTPSGVNLIVIEGCLPDPTLDTKACGDTFTPSQGNLHYRIVPQLTTLTAGSVASGKFPVQAMLLSPRVQSSIAAMQTVSLSFGRLSDTTGGAALPQLAYGAAVPDMKVQELDFTATAAGDYDAFGFTLKYAGNSVLSQSLATIQAQSSPRGLPRDFYLLPSNFVVLIVGDPTAPPAAAGPGASLHFLAVPVRDPSTLVDAGTDAGM